MEEEEKIPHIFTPFENIALCFSGGGFRAASYSLGVLSYLNRIKLNEVSLLKHVKYISSTSGGTITNLVYSAALCLCDNEEQSFRDSFEKLYRGMSNEGLLQMAVDLLADDTYWAESGVGKTRNVINAFSIVYDRELFKGETFGIYLDKPKTRDLSVCFNATEFVHGITFRFQLDRSMNIFKLVGNKYIYFDHKKADVLRRVKLADILAASSCFPAGFEPIIFPGDFAYEEVNSEELKSSLITENYDGVTGILDQDMALMDGGVTDNQAVYSAMNADGRRGGKDKPPFDLFIVTDVTSYFMKPYDPPKEKGKSWDEDTVDDYLAGVRKIGLTYGKVKLIVIAALTLSIGVLALSASESWKIAALVLFGAGLLGVAVLVYIHQKAQKSRLLKMILKQPEKISLSELIKELPASTDFSKWVMNKLTWFLEHVTLKTLYAMILARIQTVVTMSVEVNLKHGRRLIFDLFYKNAAFDNRRLPNFIYELGASHVFERNRKYADPNQPASILSIEEKRILMDVNPILVVLAEESRNMGTTLWFGEGDSKKKMLDKIIQCGQFTTCVNLLEYTMILLKQQANSQLTITPDMINQLKDLRIALETDWTAFNKHADFLFEEEIKFMK